MKNWKGYEQLTHVFEVANKKEERHGKRLSHGMNSHTKHFGNVVFTFYQYCFGYFVSVKSKI
jgi:hypothetical protein